MKSVSRSPILFLTALALALTLSPVQAEEHQSSGPAAQVSGNKITLQLQGMDVIEVMKILTEEAGFNLVAGSNVKGSVTLFLKDVDPWEAFEVILSANELAYERKGDIVTVMTGREYEALHGKLFEDRRILKTLTPQHTKVKDVATAISQIKSSIGRIIADESTNTLIVLDVPSTVDQMVGMVREMDLPVQTQVFSLNYGAVSDLAQAVQDALTPGLGTAIVDERTNQVVVTDYPKKLSEIQILVNAFDERTTQVFIDAKIVQVTLSDKFQFGIDWEVLARENINIKQLNALNLTNGGILKIAQSAILNEGDYSLLIEALRTYGNSEILSEPRLTVVNNQEAKILVGSKEPFVTKNFSQGTSNVVTSETITFLDVGVSLFVTPTITRDGFVLLKIAPQISSKTGTLTTSEGNEIPIIDTTEAETVLLVENGGTVIMGGLIKDEVTKDQKRIPLLGDIPFVGGLFRNTADTVKKTELVVFITTQIVTGEKTDFFMKTREEIHPVAQRQWPLEEILLPEVQSVEQGTPAPSSVGSPRASLSVEAPEVFSEADQTHWGLKTQPAQPIRVAQAPVLQPQSPIVGDKYLTRMWESISDNARSQKLPKGEEGRIVLEFDVRPDGRLKGKPRVVSRSSKRLASSAVRSVLQAAPFSPFPEEMGKETRTFKVPISYRR